ncbi:hypothetical protein MU852_04405 [Brevundimonas albigilva]|uniref:NAD(P)-dependent oxidoreductase n=1 Tax=Brevundimonas albigilva TaxID=1312364 RepID=UPI00201B7CA2|nr:NAD(P)-dependent oxidoreductase [Brevundimonas albigilva]UQV19100.1 hypothetical protein MU852_04405 [Brevundimonas albigilva]
MRVFLASVPLEAARVVIVGAGEPALAKLRLFLNTPADLAWFAPDGEPATLETPQGAPAPAGRTPHAQDFAGARAWSSSPCRTWPRPRAWPGWRGRAGRRSMWWTSRG